MGRKDFVFKIDDKELSKQLERAMKKMPEEVAKAVNDCTLDLAEQSSNRAPVETGDLRGNCVAEVNGTVVFENTEPTGAKPPAKTLTLGKVSYSLPYALRQHEELGYDHNRTDGERRIKEVVRHTTENGKVSSYIGAGSVNRVAGGEAKFLERPFEERKEKYINRFKEVINKVFKK